MMIIGGAQKKIVTECKICGIPVDNPCGENKTFSHKMRFFEKNTALPGRIIRSERQMKKWKGAYHSECHDGVANLFKYQA